MLLLASPLHAELLFYRARLGIDGAAFTGSARLQFALIGERCVALWPSEPIRLQVSDGEYEVRLGDSAQAPPIPEAMLWDTSAPKLRIWLERPDKGWPIAGPDVALKDESAQASDGSQNAAILAELREIRALLKGKPDAARIPEAETVTVSVAGAPSIGNAEAPLVLVEFTDFQCPYCITFQPVVEALKAKYVETGKLRVVSRNVPQGFHRQAGPAALCAEERGNSDRCASGSSPQIGN